MLSTQLRTFRQHLGLSQERAAQLFGCTAKTVRRWEQGRHKPSRIAEKSFEYLLERLEKDQK
jgi:DNA-binding transcriptional regulator YiaG